MEQKDKNGRTFMSYSFSSNSILSMIPFFPSLLLIFVSESCYLCCCWCFLLFFSFFVLFFVFFFYDFFMIQKFVFKEASPIFLICSQTFLRFWYLKANHIFFFTHEKLYIQKVFPWEDIAVKIRPFMVIMMKNTLYTRG